MRQTPHLVATGLAYPLQHCRVLLRLGGQLLEHLQLGVDPIRPQLGVLVTRGCPCLQLGERCSPNDAGQSMITPEYHGHIVRRASSTSW